VSTLFLVVWLAVAFAMFVTFVRKREAIADVQRYQAHRLYGRDLPPWLARGGGWFNIAVSGGMVAIGVVLLVTRLT
jgi:hypothetical protein